MMSFLSDDDKAARRRNTNPPPPPREEIVAYSQRKARDELPRVLKGIKKTYRDGTPGIGFSFDKSPARGDSSREDPLLDNQVMVEELVRLIRAEEPSLICTLDRGNGPTKSGFNVSFRS